MFHHRLTPATAVSHRPGGAWLGRAIAVAALAVAAAWARAAPCWGAGQEAQTNVFAGRREVAAMLLRYFEHMSRPKPLVVRTGAEFQAHRRAVRQKLLACAGLWPLPDRPPLDTRESRAVDHDWCTVRRVAYQLWPGVYSSALLYLPKQLAERIAPASPRRRPAVLCPHGHWQHGNAHPDVQTRCLVLAKMGYVVLSPSQNHYEDPLWGISHQTVMIWTNVRALDLLASLPEVDAKRIGCTGASGGGLQTQMLLAVDDRVAAASICGLTCDYREIVFAGAAHCACNHFPNIMRYTDQPEISALGLGVRAGAEPGGAPLPTPVQYLTMNDWTRSFPRNNFPTIRGLYEANGAKGQADCAYWPTAHNYDRAKRERMYGWMEQWLRGRGDGKPVPEPPGPGAGGLPVQTLLDLKAEAPGNKGFGHISRLYAQKLRPATLKLGTRAEWQAYRREMRAVLADLLGETAPPQPAEARRVGAAESDGLAVERLLCPGEAGLLVPTLLLGPGASKARLPVVAICDDRGKAALLADRGADSPGARARAGCLVALPDVRFVGELSLAAIAGLSKDLLTFQACSPLGEGKADSFEQAWQRNAMLWGRPIPGMAAADLRAVLDCVCRRKDADTSRITLIARGRSAAGALFAAALDDRVTHVQIDLQGRCFQKGSLPLVPFVLRHGDVVSWAALLADRKLTLAGVPAEAGDTAWLKDVFRAAGNADGLRLVAPEPPGK